MRINIKLTISLFAGLSLLLFTACDIIDDPIREIPGGGGGDPTLDVQRVLIEKFTGHRCNNCPDVDPDVMQIKALYQDKVSFISYHVFDNFAGTNARFPTDFRTPEGTFIVDFFRFVGIPMGMVNRVDYTATGTGHRKPGGAWATYVSTELNRTPLFKINASTNWNSSNRNSEVNVEIEAVANYAEDVEVVVSAIESGIISPQYMPDNTINDNYIHESVFRFSYTPAMGTAIQKNWGIGNTDSLQVSRTVSPDFDEANMKVVVYIKQASNQKILQVAEIPLLP